MCVCVGNRNFSSTPNHLFALPANARAIIQYTATTRSGGGLRSRLCILESDDAIVCVRPKHRRRPRFPILVDPSRRIIIVVIIIVNVRTADVRIYRIYRVEYRYRRDNKRIYDKYPCLKILFFYIISLLWTSTQRKLCKDDKLSN